MAIFVQDIVDIELQKGTVQRGHIRYMAEQDIKANRIGARVLNGGEEVDLTGISVVGYFVRSDGTTVTISGSKSGSTVWVDLPQASYVYDGYFSLAIKLVGGTETVTVRFVEGMIINTQVGSLVDPGSVIPSLADYTALVSAAEAAADAVALFSISESQISGTRYKLVVTTVS